MEGKKAAVAGSRPPSTLHPQPSTLHRRRGFTLLELLIVITIISMLIAMLTTGLTMARKQMLKSEASATIQNMKGAIIDMKRNYSCEDMVLGCYSGGRAIKDQAIFRDPSRDFVAAGIARGDKLFIVEGGAAGEYTIDPAPAAAAPTELRLTATGFTAFSAGEVDLDYFILRNPRSAEDGYEACHPSADDKNVLYPAVDVPRELDPANLAWTRTYTTGMTAKDTVTFSDGSRDFVTDNVAAGDWLCIVSGNDAGNRAIVSVAAGSLTVQGGKFTTTSAADLSYYTYRVHMNARKSPYYTPKKKRIVNGQFLDPWRKPYVYRLKWVVGSGGSITVVEELVCSGPDLTLGSENRGDEGRKQAADDIVGELRQVPVRR